MGFKRIGGAFSIYEVISFSKRLIDLESLFLSILPGTS